MTITDTPWPHPDPEQAHLSLVKIPDGVVHSFARAEFDGAAAQFASPYLAGPDFPRLWRLRSAQIAETPADAPWITRLLVDRRLLVPVGVAGFHAAPTAAGMVEVGYQVDPEYRRRGYARRALEILLSMAGRHPDVCVVRATISPDNGASRALVAGYGFTEVGEQWDDEDGLETIFEVSVPTPGEVS